jgi:hypothetical protein
MTDAVGPIFAAGDEIVTKSGYTLLYLPDLHNDELQREGKPPVYWWLPNEVRLARRENGDYKFSFIHFEGVPGGSAGADGKNEVTGGLLGFSTTSAPPGSVLQEAQDELLNRCRGKSDKYWGWRTPVAPMFRPAPIVANATTITNLSPNPDGSVPAPASGSRGVADGRPRMLRAAPQPARFRSPRSVALRDAQRASNLDQWYANLQGQGSGSVTPFAENAYSGLVGSLPAALIWSSFHGGTGGISVWQKLKIKVWSPMVHIHIEGDWSRIQAHFSAAAHYGGVFWSADIQAEFNYMRTQGIITAVVEVDTTLPNADKIQEELNKRSDMIFQKFLDQAQKTIFEPAPFKEEPAATKGGFLGIGAGIAFKLRADVTTLNLAYDERREMAYLQDFPISSQLEGLYDAIKADPAAETKYFTTLYLSDWERKVARNIKAIVNWPDPSQKWVGEPVNFLSAQIGYPNTDGVPQWDGHVFQSTDKPDSFWSTSTEMKKAEDVKQPPAGWIPDKTFVKRQIHFSEPPNENENPFVRVFVEKNVVDLDSGDNGSLMNDINLEVRVDNVGMLNVGPILLDFDLENAKQFVEVTLKALGKTDDGKERQPTRLSWKFEDQATPRYWMIYTGQSDFVPKYQYQVRVTVKGSLTTKGSQWTGPWQDASGGGPLMISVPAPDDPGVTKRSLPVSFGAHPPAAGPSAPPPVAPSGGAPPPSRAAAGVPAEDGDGSMFSGYSPSPAG